MTEAEWLICTNPKAMFAHVAERITPRQSLLLACACGRRYCCIWESSAATDEYYGRVKPTVDASCARIIAAVEETADSPLIRETAHELLNSLAEGTPIGLYNDVAQTVRGNAAWWIDGFPDLPRTAKQQGMLNASELQKRGENDRFRLALLRCIFGNPFHPLLVDPSWLTSTVLPLARQMYESGDFSTMPILADALQDAGCDNQSVLDHCRLPGDHVRGCFVVDALLGKS